MKYDMLRQGGAHNLLAPITTCHHRWNQPGQHDPWWGMNPTNNDQHSCLDKVVFQESTDTRKHTTQTPCTTYRDDILNMNSMHKGPHHLSWGGNVSLNMYPLPGYIIRL